MSEKSAGLNKVLRLLNEGWHIESTLTPNGRFHNFIMHKLFSEVLLVGNFEMDTLLSMQYIECVKTEHAGSTSVRTWRKA